MKKYQIVYADPPWSYGANSFPSTSDKQAYCNTLINPSQASNNKY